MRFQWDFPALISPLFEKILQNLWFLAATKQLYEWLSLSICHTFFTMFSSSYHEEIFRSYYQWPGWGQCERSRSKVKVTEVKTQLNRFRNVTPVWITIWWWNDVQSSMLLWRGALLFFKVIHQISRSHRTKITDFDPNWGFPDCNLSLNSPIDLNWCTKLELEVA